MLYYIIPPIVMVISLGALIYFISKKAPAISREQLLRPRQERGMMLPRKEKRSARFFQFLLLILEKIFQRFKLFSLRFYNTADSWFRSIRERRKRRISNINVAPTVQEKSSLSQERKNIAQMLEEKDLTDVEPMISRQVAEPDEPTVKEKSELEKTLIERIAMNPRDVEAYERLGSYYIEVGNLADARECFYQVLKLSPINRRARVQLKRLDKILRR